MMGMGNCCLGRASIRWQNTFSEVWVRRKGQSRHSYVSHSSHSNEIQQISSGQQPEETVGHSWLVSIFSVASYYSSEDGVCMCVCISYHVMFLLYQV